MTKKKTKLTLTGIVKKSIQNIELAKTQSKNTVIIEKKTSRFSNKGSFSRPTEPRPQKNLGFRSNDPSTPRSSTFSKPASPITNNFEKRKLAEQRATRRLKGEVAQKDSKGKTGSKKRELKLTVSRALSEIGRASCRERV